ncbi:hypothetical protein Tco_0157279 [Tanacetum coccineum]
MTAFPKISHRVCDKYHNLEDDEMVKSIFNSRKNMVGVGMKIPSWMIITEHYQMYAAVFEVDVPTTHSQPIEFTQRTHRTTSSPRSLNPNTNKGESNTIQLSLAEQESRDELEAKQNVQKFKGHLIAEEIEKLVEGMENVGANEVDSSTLRQNDYQNNPGTTLEPKSNNESLEVEITTEVQLVNVNEEEEELAEDDYKLK